MPLQELCEERSRPLLLCPFRFIGRQARGEKGKDSPDLREVDLQIVTWFARPRRGARKRTAEATFTLLTERFEPVSEPKRRDAVVPAVPFANPAPPPHITALA